MDRNIKLAYILSFLRNTWFWLGIWVFFYLRYTNYAGIGLVETAFIISMTASEIPTGAVADLFGKRNTLIISFFLMTLGVFFISFTFNVFTLTLGVIIAGIGGSFFSGTLDALVYDSLLENKREEIYGRVISNMGTISLITPAICGIIGGFLYIFNPRLPFFLNSLGYFIGIFFSFFLIEPKIDSEKFSFTNFINQTKFGIRELTKKTEIINQTIFLLSIGFILVIADEMLDSFLGVEFGFKPKELSVLWSVIYMTSAFSSQLAPYFIKHFKKSFILFLLTGLLIMSFIISPFIGIILGGISLLLRSSLMVIYNNISSVMINQQTIPKYRATTLSTFNMLKNIPYVLTAYSIGSLADSYSARIIAVYLGFILFVLTAYQLYKITGFKKYLPEI